MINFLIGRLARPIRTQASYTTNIVWEWESVKPSVEDQIRQATQFVPDVFHPIEEKWNE